MAISREEHGLSRTPEHMIWLQIKQRCTNPKNKRYADYGGRGIKMHLPWQISFTQFLADVGNRPCGPTRMTLDRIENNKGYEPGNTRWTTWTTQSRNRRNVKKYTVGDKTLYLKEWSILSGVRMNTLNARIQNGWSIEDAVRPVSQSVRSTNKMLTYKGETLPMADMARKHNVPVARVKNRIRNGWSVERAIEEPVNSKHG